jgi:ribosomal protein S18 acetylase RimI-like enzyme
MGGVEVVGAGSAGVGSAGVGSAGGSAGVGSAGVEVRAVRGLNGRRVFVDVPFRIHGGDPSWIPPLRLGVHERISPRHPANQHQHIKLWIAYRHGRPVGRIGACIDSAFDRFQGVHWGWVGFYDSFDDPAVARALFDVAKSWLKQQGAETCVGPANFTTNDEIGLQVDGFDDPPVLLTLQNPRYYEALWTEAGWQPMEDLWAWHFDKLTTALSDRQRRVLARIRQRSGFTVRSLVMSDFDNEVRLFFDLYNAAWSRNLAFAPMSEDEVSHLAKELKPIIRPEWAFGVEDRDGTLIGVCIALPDINRILLRARSGRLLPITWLRLLHGRRRQSHARVFALGIRPEHQNLAVGPLLYQEVVDRLAADPYIRTAEGGWTLASNHRINDQLQAMGARRSKVWRLYQQTL